MVPLSRHGRTRLRPRIHQYEAESRAALFQEAGGAARHQRAIDRVVQAAVAEVARIARRETNPVDATPDATPPKGVAEPSFDREYLSAYLAVQAETMAAVLKQAYLLIHEGKLSRERVLQPLLQAIADAGEQLLADAIASRAALPTPPEA